MSALVPTEHADPRYAGLDGWDDSAILSALLDGQKRGIDAVNAAIPDIAKAAALGVAALQSGGRLIYVGAGSPGLIALGDALEIPQTYGVARDRIVIVMAGGLAMTEELLGGPEDDAGLGAAANSDANINIVAGGHIDVANEAATHDMSAADIDIRSTGGGNVSLGSASGYDVRIGNSIFGSSRTPPSIPAPLTSRLIVHCALRSTRSTRPKPHELPCAAPPSTGACALRCASGKHAPCVTMISAGAAASGRTV